MKVLAAVEVDLDESALGTKSRAAESLCGTPVLTRTVQRLAAADRVDGVVVLCPPGQSRRCHDLLEDAGGSRVSIRETRVPGAPFRGLIRTARKWSLDGWRGGLGGTCVMDEFTRTDELALLAQQESADALVCASPCGPLIDPRLLDRMIEHSHESVEESRLTFAQAPPGLTATVYRTELLLEMGQQRVPPSLVLSYKPDAPQMDLAHKVCCFTAPEAVRHGVGRLIVDTRRAFETVEAFLRSGLPDDAESVSRWLIERATQHVPPLPREVEIELTTADQLPDAKLRPRGRQVGDRENIDLAVVEKIARELVEYDDALVVLGGFGEPLLHPQFDDVLAVLREAGIYGVAVRTNGIALDAERIASLIRHRVDVLNVVLDAWTPKRYAEVQGANCLNDVLENLRRLADARNQAQSVAPLVVPEITKALDSVDELDPFFDGWVRECGWANIAGYSHYARQRDDLAVADMTPPRRIACRRLWSRALVLADGKLCRCDRDFTGAHPVGNLHDSTLAELWTGPVMTDLRDRHRRVRVTGLPLCPTCDDWHRP